MNICPAFGHQNRLTGTSQNPGLMFNIIPLQLVQTSLGSQSPIHASPAPMPQYKSLAINSSPFPAAGINNLLTNTIKQIIIETVKQIRAQKIEISGAHKRTDESQREK
jgi:hypothetical protein